MTSSWRFVAHSDARRRALSFAKQAASADCSVLIVGPTGAGKDILARDIHQHSRRSKHRIITVNCAALTQTLFESELFGHVRGAYTGATASKRGVVELASGGSLFLDEIGELPMEAQAKLLRFLADGSFWPVGGSEEKSVDVRILAATNRDLAAGLDTTFRSDLFFRLSVFTIVVPPPSRDDLRGLTRVLALEMSERYRVPLAAREVSAVGELASSGVYRGNVRELRNAVERYFLVRDPERTVEENWRAACALDLLAQQGEPPQDAAAVHQIHPRGIEKLDDLLFLMCATETRSARELSRRMNRSLPYVYSRLAKLGIKPKDLQCTESLERTSAKIRASLAPYRSTFLQLLKEF
ncbi:sigma-54 factor interaction domain-containing protein [Sorangium sp. So ce260]|uniref:sigma 54-interacting transcriptional regulator n=1 Tax=Sorangium sp. So ce260 TaxID=3133291 RepID=UPI003F60467B